jgi:hypothetical protein
MTAALFECTNQDLADFLRNKPLYAKMKAITVTGHERLAYHTPGDLHKKAFKFLCPVEKEVQTFKTQPPYGSHPFLRTHMSDDHGDQLPEYFNEKSGKLDHISELVGCCQSCGATISFLIRQYSDYAWPERGPGLSIFLQKVGQFPAYDIQPDKEIQNT